MKEERDSLANLVHLSSSILSTLHPCLLSRVISGLLTVNCYHFRAGGSEAVCSGCTAQRETVIGSMGKSHITLGAEIMDPLLDVGDPVEYIKMEKLASKTLPHHSRFLLNSVILDSVPFFYSIESTFHLKDQPLTRVTRLFILISQWIIVWKLFALHLPSLPAPPLLP
jgi:hypothetical protein